MGDIMKKGQATEMFTYAITFIIVGLVLVFGYMAIKALVGSGETAVEDKFRDSIKKDLEKYNLLFDDKPITYVVPKDVTKVCFLDMSKETRSNFENQPVVPRYDSHNQYWGHINSSAYTLIRESYNSNDTTNVFLVRGSRIEPFLKADATIKNKENPFMVGKCFDVIKGKLSIELEGGGKLVYVKDYSVYS
jgi:hypothetical protein